jgi:hypothetical protein
MSHAEQPAPDDELAPPSDDIESGQDQTVVEPGTGSRLGRVLESVTLGDPLRRFAQEDLLASGLRSAMSVAGPIGEDSTMFPLRKKPRPV